MPATAPSETVTAQQQTPPKTPKTTLQLALILVAAFMVVLDFSIVNVALPAIERELRMPAAAVQWVVTGYAISFGGLLILGGRAADLLGRRRMFIIGLVAFALASLAGGLAQDPVLLIAARVIQGAGAAIVAPAALSLITTSFPEGPRRTRAIGLYGAIASVGFVSGQVLGGVLVQFTSWRAVFLVNVPVGLAAAALAPAILGTAPKIQKTKSLDIRGALLITLAVALAVFAISQGVVLGWTSPLVIAATVVAAATTVAFVKTETRHPDPLVRPALLRRPSLRNGSTLSFLLGLWNGGEMLIMSLYLQQVLHESPLFTGLVIAPQGVVGFTMGVFGPRLAGKLGVSRLLIVTGAATAVGFAVLTRLPAAGYSPVLLVVMLIGFGTAGTAFGSVVLASRGMADSDQGLVGGMINTSRQIGAAVGAALLPAVAQASGAGVDGDRAAMLIAGLAALAATAVAARAAHPALARARTASLGPPPDIYPERAVVRAPRPTSSGASVRSAHGVSRTGPVGPAGIGIDDGNDDVRRRRGVRRRRLDRRRRGRTPGGHVPGRRHQPDRHRRRVLGRAV
jgi:EmrB/QacA subfamily drug resistance transporter